MKFILIGIGSVGDVYPCLGIGRELQRRGHEVQLVANPYFQSAIESADLPFVPLGTLEEQQHVLNHRNAYHRIRSGWVWLKHTAIRWMRELYELILREYQPGQTVVAASWGGLGARIAQEREGVPFATLHLEPDRLRTTHDSSVFPIPGMARPWHPRWLTGWQYRLFDRLLLDRLMQPINDFRQSLGLDPVQQYLQDWWHSPQRIVGLFPDWWGPPQPDWPTQTRLVGFPFWDQPEGAEPDPELLEFLDAGPPPVVFTPGADNRSIGQFFEVAVAASRRLGCRSLLLTRQPDLLPQPLPAEVRHFGYVPFSLLFSRAAALVHRAGIGSSAQAMRAALPQVCIPQMHTHVDTAHRLQRLQAGLTLPPRQLTDNRLADNIERVLTDERITAGCRTASERLANNDAIPHTCDLLEQLVGTDGEGAAPGRHSVPDRASSVAASELS